MLLTILMQNVMIPVVPPTPTEQSGDGVRRHEHHIYKEPLERRKIRLRNNELILNAIVDFVINQN